MRKVAPDEGGGKGGHVRKQEVKTRIHSKCETNDINPIVTTGKGKRRDDSRFRKVGIKVGQHAHPPAGQRARPLWGVLILRSSRLNSFESFSNPLSLFPPMVVSPEVEGEMLLASCLSNK